MNWRTTGWLILATVTLALFIAAFERPARLARLRAVADPRVLPAFEPAAVRSVLIRFPSNDIVILRTNDAWEVALPERRPAQADRVENLLRQIAELQGRSVLSASELRARPQAAAEFGLNPPAVTIALANPSGQLELLLGARSVNGRQVFYQAAGVLGIFATDAALLDALPTDPDGWRDRTLIPLDRLEFDRLRVSTAGTAFTLARNPATGLWEMVEPRPARADSERVGILLRQLSFLQVLHFVAPTSAPPADAIGLQQPRLTLSLGRGPRDVYQLTFGATVTNAPAVFARRAGSDDLLAVPLDAVELLRLSYKDLLDRRVLRFDRAAVREIAFEGPEAFQVVLESQGNWRLLPANRPADTPVIQRLLAQLDTLEIADIAKEVVTDLDLHTYGLAPPAGRITLRSRPGDTNAVLAVLETGALRDNRVFARIPGEQPVYALFPSDIEQLPTASWKVRDRALFPFDPSRVAAINVSHQGLDWSIRRIATNDWAVPAGWRSELNPFALEEAVFRLSQARATEILGEGDVRHLGTTNGPQVTLVFRATPPRPPLRLSFGKSSPGGHRYTAVTTPDGTRLTCELPAAVFEDLWREIGLANPGVSPP